MLITSISGIRGTLGGVPGESLTPIDIVQFISGYGAWVKKNTENPVIVIGRDGRMSGSMIINLAVQTLVGLGIKVINLDYATTPTVAMQVAQHNAHGGIIITASHNPIEYNGIKMLNREGEFISHTDGQEILSILNAAESMSFASVEKLGQEIKYYNHTKDHIDAIVQLDLVDVERIKSKKIKVALDAINSVGGIAVPMLLEKLGVEVVGLNCSCDGKFTHNPEPLPENLGELRSLVTKTQSDIGIAVDPDGDRLVFVDEQGNMFGEEYTIVAIGDYILEKTPGATVSNLSSSRAFVDMTHSHNQKYYASAVGEKNVVEKMKEVNAVFGGEGSGGVIYPPLHYGRDALVGIALFLSFYAQKDMSMSQLRQLYTSYFMSKEKIQLDGSVDVDALLNYFAHQYVSEDISTIDGVKINFSDSWVHLRKSNTEPIIRIYTEALSQVDANTLVDKFITEIKGQFE